MTAFLDIMRLSAKTGKIVNVPCHYIRYCYYIHRQQKSLSCPIATTENKFYIASSGIVYTVDQFSKLCYKY